MPQSDRKSTYKLSHGSSAPRKYPFQKLQSVVSVAVDDVDAKGWVHMVLWTEENMPVLSTAVLQVHVNSAVLLSQLEQTSFRPQTCLFLPMKQYSGVATG